MLNPRLLIADEPTNRPGCYLSSQICADENGSAGDNGMAIIVLTTI